MTEINDITRDVIAWVTSSDYLRRALGYARRGQTVLMDMTVERLERAARLHSDTPAGRIAYDYSRRQLENDIDWNAVYEAVLAIERALPPRTVRGQRTITLVWTADDLTATTIAEAHNLVHQQASEAMTSELIRQIEQAGFEIDWDGETNADLD